MLDTRLFDHTILRPDATKKEVIQICKEAKEHHFMSVCVNGCYTALVARELAGSDVKVCTVIGFPLGAMSTASKVAETTFAISDGAQEIDMVINVGALRGKEYDAVYADIKAIKHACGKAPLKVIIETCLLTEEEKIKACEIAEKAGADFVKTSTGFSTGGATQEDVALMRKTVGDRMGVKASGGIRDKETAQKMVEAGANRLGTSATCSICQ